MTKKDLLIKNLKNMRIYGDMSFYKVTKEAFSTIKPSKTRILVILTILVILSHPIYLCIKSDKTLIYIKDIVTLTNSIIIAMFAILFTGYALFQALVDRNTLKVLFINQIDSKSKHNLFEHYNLYFFIFCILCVCLITSNYIITFILSVIDPQIIKLTNESKNFVSSIFIYFYLLINIFAITEIKSFIFNLFKCFNISAISRMIESLEKYDDNLHEKQ